MGKISNYPVFWLNKSGKNDKQTVEKIIFAVHVEFL